MSDMDGVVKEFLVESFENLDHLAEDFLTLEKAPTDREVLSRLFRTIHTIKGTCGFLGYAKLESLAHAGESVLARLRDGALALDGPITDALLAMADGVRKILQEIERTGADGSENYEEVKHRLLAFTRASASPPPAPPPPPPVAIAAEGAKPAPVASTKTADGASSDAPSAAAGEEGDRGGSAVADASVRVDVALLDRLMTLTGELVLARNQLLQVLQPGADARALAVSQRLSYVTSELQESVTKTRMQPIGGAWSRLPRMVRDLCASLGKKISLETEGREVELDRSLIDAVKDPLTHIIRNACDHGIEKPEDRVRRGKAPEGKIRVRAFHRAGLVNVEVEDDGGGISVERVRRKSIERGLLTEEQAKLLDDDAVRRLVFRPGFSTADAVTNVSGRGVGMDVVKTSIEKIGGAVEVSSEEGVGTKIVLRIPLTLAIVPALTVACGGERFAVPHGSVRELVRLEEEAEAMAARLELIGDTPVLRIRETLLPVVRLRAFVGALDGSAPPVEEHVVVLQSEDRRFGLIVDDVCDTREIVVKPLLAALRSNGLFAGATIMGDGGVVLVLDVAGVARSAGVDGDAAATSRDVSPALAATGFDGVASKNRWLMASCGGRRIALPLERILRLEQIDVASVERAGGEPVVQYRGGLLPLKTPCFDMGARDACERRSLQVVVVGADSGPVGVVVDDVEDVVGTSEGLRRAEAQGVTGVVFIDGKVVEVPDLDALVPSEARS
jgi:two-component system, chemotaxis family, sensor kinase CheA